VSPAEPFNALHLEQNNHNGPQWFRLSLWAGCSDAQAVLNGSNFVPSVHHAQSTSLDLNVDELVEHFEVSRPLVMALLTTYVLDGKPKKRGMLFSATLFEEILKTKGPPPESASYKQALKIVSAKFFPAPVWQLGSLRYWSKADLIKAKVSIPLRYGKELDKTKEICYDVQR